MNADWVAASVRARSLAQRRAGAGAALRIASQGSLAQALDLLAETSYAARLRGQVDLVAAERATRETVLWQLRVLAGWMPAAGARLFRTAAGAFERDNIVALANELDGGRPAPEPFALGALATAWPQVRSATSLTELTEGLRRSPWGDVGSYGAGSLLDVLTIVWMRRLADVAPPARRWAEGTGALIAARILLVDENTPTPRLRELLRPLLGRAWEGTRSVEELHAALARSARTALDGVDGPAELWRADARLRGTVETDGFRLLRTALPGPDVILGALAVLATDAWRVRAALAAASAGTGSSEVLDAVA